MQYTKLTAKTFATSLTAISKNTVRGTIQNALMYSFQTAKDNGDLTGFNKVVNAIIKGNHRCLSDVIAYIKAHANVSMSRKDDTVTFKKAGKKKDKLVITIPTVTLENWSKPKQEPKEKTETEKQQQYAKSVYNRMQKLGMTKSDLLAMLAKIEKDSLKESA